MKKNDIVVAFTHNSNKKTARVFCRRFRHCCVLFPAGNGGFTLVQIGLNGVRLIPVGPREIKIMKKQGWKFAKTQIKPCESYSFNFLTCVGFAKRALGIRNLFIWTPDQLYNKLRQRRSLLLNT